MEHAFWSSRWQTGATGFHLTQVNPNLPKYWALAAPDAASVLVPLCGKSLDLLWLRDRGHEVSGVEFVGEAIDAFFQELGAVPEVHQLGAAKRYVGAGLQLLQADFFELGPEQLAPHSAVYDRAAFVAISPERRREYFERLRELTLPGAPLLLLNFVHDLGSGPPFSIPDDELEGAARGAFTLVKHAERDILSAEPRFAERGATHMIEQVWFGTRVD